VAHVFAYLLLRRAPAPPTDRNAGKKPPHGGTPRRLPRAPDYGIFAGGGLIGGRHCVGAMSSGSGMAEAKRTDGGADDERRLVLTASPALHNEDFPGGAVRGQLSR